MALPAVVSESQLRLGLACNLDCGHCSLHSGRADRTEVESLLGQLDGMHQRGVRRVRLTGGEPTLSPHLKAVLQHCAQLGLTPLLETNGLLLASPRNRAQLAVLGLQQAEVLLPAMDSAVYAAVTGEPRGLAAATAAIDGLLAEQWQVVLAVPLLQTNVAAVPDLLVQAVARWPGLAAVRLQVYRPTAGRDPALHPHPRDWQAAARAAADQLRQAAIPLLWSLHGGLPACLLADPGNNTDLAGFADNAPLPVPACVDCSAAGRCPGPPPGLLQAYPDLQLTPLRQTSLLRRLQGANPKSRPDSQYVRWLRTRTPRGEAVVREVLLRVIQQCNERCGFCWVDFESPAMPDAVWHDALAKIAALPTAPLVSLTGGEPLLRKDLEARVAELAAAGVQRIQLQTNATLVTPQRAAALARAGVTSALIGLHAHTDALYTAITGGKGLVDKAAAGVVALLEANIHVTLNCVVDRNNLPELADYARWVALLRATNGRRPLLTFAVAAEIAGGAIKPEVLPTLTEVAGPLREALETCLALGQPFMGLAHPCGLPPCLLDGDLRFYPDLAQLRFGDGMAEDLPQAGDGKPESCNHCVFFAFCPGVREAYANRYGTAELVPLRSGDPRLRGLALAKQRSLWVLGAGQMGQRHAAWLSAAAGTGQANIALISHRSQPDQLDQPLPTAVTWQARSAVPTESHTGLVVVAGATSDRDSDLSWLLGRWPEHTEHLPWLLLEKPLGPTATESVALAQRLQRLGFAAWMSLSVALDPGLLAIQEAVAQGRIGQVQAVHWRQATLQPPLVAGQALHPAHLPGGRREPPPLLDHLFHVTAGLDVLLRAAQVPDPQVALPEWVAHWNESGWQGNGHTESGVAVALTLTATNDLFQGRWSRVVEVAGSAGQVRWLESPGGRDVALYVDGQWRPLAVATGSGHAALTTALGSAYFATMQGRDTIPAALLAPILEPMVAATWHVQLERWFKQTRV